MRALVFGLIKDLNVALAQLGGVYALQRTLIDLGLPRRSRNSLETIHRRNWGTYIVDGSYLIGAYDLTHTQHLGLLLAQEGLAHDGIVVEFYQNGDKQFENKRDYLVRLGRG